MLRISCSMEGACNLEEHGPYRFPTPRGRILAPDRMKLLEKAYRCFTGITARYRYEFHPLHAAGSCIGDPSGERVFPPVSEVCCIWWDVT